MSARAMAHAAISNIWKSANYTTAGPADAGTALDITDYDGQIGVTLNLVNLAGTSPTLAVKVVECATSGGSYTDVTSGAFTTSTGATPSETYSNQIISLDAARLKKYLKVNVTVGGTSSPGYAAMVSVVGFKKTY